jgi:hypothetical protein
VAITRDTALFESGAAWQGEGDRPRGSRQCARLGAVAIAASKFVAFVGNHAERGP